MRLMATRPAVESRLSLEWVRHVYLAAVITAGAIVVAAAGVQLVVHPVPPTWGILALFTLTTGWATVRMPGSPISVSLSDTFTMAAALMFGPSAGALLAGADGLVMSFRLPRESRTLTRLSFNTGAPAVSMWAAASLFFWLVTLPAPFERMAVPLALFGATYFFFNTGLVAGAVAIGRGLHVHAVWRDHFLPLWMTYCVGTSFAGLLLVLSAAGLATLQTFVIALPALFVAGVGLKRGADHLRERSAQHAVLRSYEAALRSTADAVVLTNAKGRVTFMNAAAENLTGVTEAAATGRPADEVVRLQAPADGSGPIVADDLITEHVLLREDGSRCPIEETHAHIRDEDGRIMGVIRTFRDITRRREVERERRALLLREQSAREAADSANRAKDDFLATLSHELRTPAAAMIGWTELLKGGRLDNERTKRAIAALERSARTQAAVLNDLLDVSRLVRGIMRIDVRPTHLPDISRESIDTVEPAMMAKQLQLRCTIADEVSVIDADPDRLRQILWNLLSNAVKFTPEDGRIEVEAVREGRFIRIRVSDSGCGIEAEFLPYAFDRFRQAEPSGSRSHGGLGLGLAIVQHLVHLHGWTVEAASDGPGRGAQFTIRLPVTMHGKRRREDRETTGPGST
jgi:PAS domain S-box-containing protein